MIGHYWSEEAKHQLAFSAPGLSFPRQVQQVEVVEEVAEVWLITPRSLCPTPSVPPCSSMEV